MVWEGLLEEISRALRKRFWRKLKIKLVLDEAIVLR